MNEVTNPTEESAIEHNNRTPAKLSRDASLKSVEREKYRTPQYGRDDISNVDEKGMEMRLRGSNKVHEDMKEVDLLGTPNKDFQDTGASSTVSRKKKLNLRRPYAKATEFGWRQSHWFRKRCIVASDRWASANRENHESPILTKYPLVTASSGRSLCWFLS